MRKLRPYFRRTEREWYVVAQLAIWAIAVAILNTLILAP